jgi:hypothetical protein
MIRGAIVGGITTLQQIERIVVKAGPDVKAVLELNLLILKRRSRVVFACPPDRALAAQTPAHLIDRDVIEVAVRIHFGQIEGSCKRTYAAAEYRDL